jgi:hypothetical protein
MATAYLPVNRPSHFYEDRHQILEMLHRCTTQAAFCSYTELGRDFLRLCDPRFSSLQVSGMDEAKVQFTTVVAQSRVQIFERCEVGGQVRHSRERNRAMKVRDLVRSAREEFKTTAGDGLEGLWLHPVSVLHVACKSCQ